MHTVSAADYFGGIATLYDSLIRRAVPRYAEMIERLSDYWPPAPADVLELGSGTGNLSREIARRFPEARATLVDASAEMQDVAREELAREFPEFASRARFVVARFEDLDVADGSYDLVTSSISLHHVADKAPVYRRVHASLRPGGAFCFADQMLGADEQSQRINWERWLAFCREPDHCTADEIASLLDHAAAHDHYTPLAEHFRMLDASGFADVDCVWRNWIWGIVTARRPLTSGSRR